jgi:hypothetical protein
LPSVHMWASYHQAFGAPEATARSDLAEECDLETSAQSFDTPEGGRSSGLLSCSPEDNV